MKFVFVLLCIYISLSLSIAADSVLKDNLTEFGDLSSEPVKELIVPSAAAVKLEISGKMIISWGEKRGELPFVNKKEQISSQIFTGPSSICYRKNKLYILDAVLGSVVIYTSRGNYLRTIRFQSKLKNTKNALYCDISVGFDGVIYVLDGNSKTVVLIDPVRKIVREISIPHKNKIAGYETLAVSKNNVISVFDCFLGQIVRFTVDGTPVGKIKTMNFSSLPSYGDNIFYGAKMVNINSHHPNALVLLKLNPLKPPKTVVGSYKTTEEINNYSVVGVDKRGKIFLTVALGTADVTSQELLIVFDENGTIVSKTKIPLLTHKMEMTRSVSVSENGSIAICRPSKSGLVTYFINQP